MGLEIERKFLVSGDYTKNITQSMKICQGYLCHDSERTVRIRLRDKQGFITIKGKTNTSGVARYEWEREISRRDAEELLQLCLPGTIEKTRSLVIYKNHIFEVDRFEGDNEGLCLAEIELQTEDEHFEKPDWLGREVTGDVRYYNSHLSRHPYKMWRNRDSEIRKDETIFSLLHGI